MMKGVIYLLLADYCQQIFNVLSFVVKITCACIWSEICFAGKSSRQDNSCRKIIEKFSNVVQSMMIVNISCKVKAKVTVIL